LDTIVLFIENEDKHFHLVKSLNILNIDYRRLFKGGAWNNFYDKMYQYIKGLEEIDNEWVILSDSRDVLFYKDLDVINSVYQKHYSEYDMVIHGEDDPRGDMLFRTTGLERYKFSDTKYCYPCSGLMMGRREKILSFLKEVVDKCPDDWSVSKTSDQPAIEWGMKNLEGYKIGIDDKCRLFQRLGMVVSDDELGVNFDLHFNKNFIKNTYTNTEPCIFHYVGKSFPQQVWKIINKRM